MRAQARSGGEDIIDLGMGNPDLPPPSTHREAGRGRAQARRARLFGVTRHPRAAARAGQLLCPPLRGRHRSRDRGRRDHGVQGGARQPRHRDHHGQGDVVLAPNPSYPIHTFGFIIAGATIRAVPTTPDGIIGRASTARSPSPCRGRRSWWSTIRRTRPRRRWTSLARATGGLGARTRCRYPDLAYSELYFDGKPTVSILQVPGAKDVAMEFTSLSKTYSMAGWRMGFAVGNAKLIAAMTRVKSYLDYGAFTPIQAAACAALNGPQDIRLREEPATLSQTPRRAGRKLRARRVGHPRAAGIDVRLGAATAGAGASGVARVFEAIADPCQGRGGAGGRLRRERRGFVRIAMVENEQRLRQAGRNVKRYLQSMGVDSAGKSRGNVRARARMLRTLRRCEGVAGETERVACR
ncbi:aminotransferase class I/II-fold pyridoxal phosphate-dependent enzyme [Sphingomonas sp. MMS24-JH45]